MTNTLLKFTSVIVCTAVFAVGCSKNTPSTTEDALKPAEHQPIDTQPLEEQPLEEQTTDAAQPLAKEPANDHLTETTQPPQLPVTKIPATAETPIPVITQSVEDNVKNTAEDKPIKAKSTNTAPTLTNPAKVLVEQFHMGDNLAEMALQISQRTNSYAVIIEKHGKDKAQNVMAQEIEKLLPSYQDKWNTNLANAYAHNLSVAELNSLATQGGNSPYTQKLMDVQTAVGTEMQNTSRPILEALLTQAMLNAMQQ